MRAMFTQPSRCTPKLPLLKLLFFFPVCAACILSCKSVPKQDILYSDLTDSAKFVLLPPGGIEHDMDMLQFLSAEFGGNSYFFNAWVKADKNAVEMVLFNEMGASMGELSYRSGSVHFTSTVIPKTVTRYIKPEFIIADFQLCFYDPFLLGKSLKDCGLVLETGDADFGDDSQLAQWRRILSGNEVIIEIKKTLNTVELTNHLRGYAYTLEGDFNDFR